MEKYGVSRQIDMKLRYNVKVNDQIYQVDLERDTTIHDAESTESSADICFEAIKAEYDYCVTRAEKLENKVYILLAACAFVFALLTTQIEKAGKLDVPQSGSELLGIIIYTKHCHRCRDFSASVSICRSHRVIFLMRIQKLRGKCGS